MDSFISTRFSDIDINKCHSVLNREGLMVCWLNSQQAYYLLDDSNGKKAIFDYLVIDSFNDEFGSLPKFNSIAKISNTDFYKIFTSINVNLDKISKQGTDIADNIDKLFESAIEEGASDIHIERNDKVAIIYFRVNGLLTEVKTMSSDVCDEMMFVTYNILATTKESTWNRSIPQDANILRDLVLGSYRFRYAHMPIFGQSGGCYHAVLRIIKAQVTDEFEVVAERDPLEILQLSSDEEKDLRSMMQIAHGLLLITGVTGSGKSTTIKNILEWMYSKKYDGNACFITVEDPVEYRIIGAIQSSVVRLKDGENAFLPALKSAMRRDPDVLMIGETRDEQTATALTSAIESGHYAVTTVHAGSVTTAIQRLESLGVKRDRLASPGFIAGIITQALVPLLCGSCKEEHSKDYYGYQRYSKNALGCNQCNGTGTFGRKPVFEMLFPDLKLLQEIALGNPTKVYQHWRDKHSEDGRVNQGYLMKEKVYLLVMKGLVDYHWFSSFHGEIEKNILRELHEKTVGK